MRSWPGGPPESSPHSCGISFSTDHWMYGERRPFRPCLSIMPADRFTCMPARKRLHAYNRVSNPAINQPSHRPSAVLACDSDHGSFHPFLPTTSRRQESGRPAASRCTRQVLSSTSKTAFSSLPDPHSPSIGMTAYPNLGCELVPDRWAKPASPRRSTQTASSY